MSGFTGGYRPAGVAHKGEYVVPAPYDYPKWTKYVWPKWLRVRINRKFRKYNPDKDLFFKLTGKRAFGDD